MGTPMWEGVQAAISKSKTRDADRKQRFLDSLFPGRASTGQGTQVANGTTSSKVGGPQLIGRSQSPLLRPGKKRSNSLLGG